jgi:hypothetical protein
LDLIANVVSEQGGLPWNAAVSRTLVGRAPDVRLYLGTPEENSSGASFAEAKLVWSSAEPDWRATTSAIVADPSAARYCRLTDVLPVRTEQVYCSNPKDLEQIVNLKDSQVLDWVWVPLDAIHVRPHTWSDEARKFANFVGRSRGRKTQDVMQFVIQHHEQSDNYVTWHQNRLSPESFFRIGGAQVFVGRPAVQLDFLNEISCSSLVIAPHRSRRGPNGLWIISRATNHPVEQSFGKRSLYYLSVDRHPDFVCEIADWQRIFSLELFMSRDRAEKAAAKQQAELKEEGIENVGLDVQATTGSDLLRLISAADVIELARTRLAISRDGMFFDGLKEVATVETLSALIDRIQRKRKRALQSDLNKPS